jgi:FkbM family methyltransferase
MISSFSKFLRTRSFRMQPIATLWRGFLWLSCHILPQRRAIITLRVGGQSFKMDLPPLLKSFGSTGIFIQRRYYEPLLQFCDRLIGPGAVAFDCGANQGIYSCAFAALVGPSGRVIAFEPQPYAIAALRNNLKMNRFDQVWVEEAALSNCEGTAQLDCSAGAVSASIVQNFGGTKTEMVRTSTLSSVSAKLELKRIDLIKLDIEGSEYDALESARELLAQFKPKLVLEGSLLHPNWGQLNEYLFGLGYRPHLFDVKGDLVPITGITQYEANIVYVHQ